MPSLSEIPRFIPATPSVEKNAAESAPPTGDAVPCTAVFSDHDLMSQILDRVIQPGAVAPRGGRGRALLGINREIRAVARENPRIMREANLDAGRCKTSKLPGHTLRVRPVLFSPNGRYLASASSERTILWDLGEKPHTPVTLPSNEICAKSLAFSADGNCFVIGSGARVVVWDLQRPVPSVIKAINLTRACNALALSPNGEKLVTAQGWGNLQLWHVDPAIADCTNLEGNQKPFQIVAFSPCGTHVVGADRTCLYLWDVNQAPATCKLLGRHEQKISALVFVPDGKGLIVASEDRKMGLWNLRHDQPTWTQFARHSDVPRSLALSPDGTRLASNYGRRYLSDDAERQLNLWDLSQNGIAWMDVAGHAASASEDAVRGVVGEIGCIDVAGSEGVTSVAFSPDGDRIATGSADGTVCLRDFKAADGDTASNAASRVPSKWLGWLTDCFRGMSVP